MDEAEVCLRRAISLRGGHAESHERLGSLFTSGENLLKQGGHSKVNSYLSSCHRAQKLGDTLKALGKFDDAKAAYLQT